MALSAVATAQRECPACHHRVGAMDFMCTRCERVLDPSLATRRPDREISLVRRMLEVPQPGVPSVAPAHARVSEVSLGEGHMGPTRLFKMPVELMGIPFVIANLVGPPPVLTEFEAWLMSKIDGASSAKVLAQRVELNELEVNVVLKTLFDKGVVALSEAPLSDDDLELSIDVELDDVPQSLPPVRNTLAAQATTAAAEPPMLAPVTASGTDTASRKVMPVHKSDPRIIYSGAVNPRVLDALKKVKRVASQDSQSSNNAEKPQTLADIQARETLQVALRMEQGGRFDEAIRFLQKAIGQSPEAASLYNRLGIILMRERADYIRAENMIRKAIELAPENAVYQGNLHQVFTLAALRKG